MYRQFGRAFYADVVSFALLWERFLRYVYRFIHTRINARKAYDGNAARKTAYIANFSHKLRGSCFSNTVHGVYSFVLRELERKPRHLCLQSGQCGLTRQKLLGGCDDEQLCVLVFW